MLNIRQAFVETFWVLGAIPGEITSIAFEAVTNRLAVSNRKSVVQLFQVGPKIDLHPRFTVVINGHVPKAIAFGQGEKVIYTFGLYDGKM